MTEFESKQKIIDFYSALIMVRFLNCGYSSELGRLDRHIKRVYYIALGILEHAVATQNVLLFHEILTASKDLIPVANNSFVSAEMRAKIDKVQRMFMVNVGDLLEQDVGFAWNYNCICKKTIKIERFNIR